MTKAPADGVAAVEGHVGGDASPPEAFGDQFCQLGLVFGQPNVSNQLIATGELPLDQAMRSVEP